MDQQTSIRLNFAKSTTRIAGDLALEFFQSINKLVIEQKSVQDHVSNADLDVEKQIRALIKQSFPDDGIVGEEFDNVASRSGYTWVIDPIDGTANFIRGIPSWCVVLACVHDDHTIIGVVQEPCHDEMFWCARGHGAYLNDEPMQVATTTGINDGSVGVGMNGRTAAGLIVNFISLLLDNGGIFYRNASGALMLSYVAAGRLIAYVEPHMNAWDCLAGQLLVAEAGGHIEAQSADAMIASGGRVVTATPVVFEQVVQMSNEAFATPDAS